MSLNVARSLVLKLGTGLGSSIPQNVDRERIVGVTFQK